MEALQQCARDYLTCETNPEYISAVEAAMNNEEQLKKYFGTRLTFGTAGMRGTNGPGYSGINKGLILQVAQGYCQYLLKTFGEAEVQSKGIVIGYDARHGSRDYAEITASIFNMRGCKVYLFGYIVPTPIVSFAIRHLGAAGGVMVTASHNPSQDNGYKVYMGNGAQIIEPHDSGIRACIAENLTKWEGFNQSIFATSDLTTDPIEDVLSAYYDMIHSKLCFHEAENKQKSGLIITYSAMHGVGYRPTLAAFKKFNLPLPIPVPEQIEGNGDFPTSEFPNPEEGEKVFKHSFRVADAHGSDMIICQDPDADRVGLAIRKEDGSWQILHGNHTGALITWWIIQHYKGDRSKAKFYNSAVSTQFTRFMAEKEGFMAEETLTGFKWLGNAALRDKEQGITPLVAFEEAIGFECIPGEIPDKDAVSTAAVVAEMAHYIMRTEHKTLLQKLDDIYAQYGYYLFNNYYFINHNPQNMTEIFQRMRTSGPNGSYIDKIGSFPIAGIRDMTMGYDSRTPDHVPVLPKQSGQMITFYLENGCIATIRGSGTEPKIKWYIEIGAADKQKATSDLEAIVCAVKDDLLQREKYGFQ